MPSTITSSEGQDSTFYEDTSPAENGVGRTNFFNINSSDNDLPIQGSVLGSTGPVGEPGLPPSRPVSVTTGGSSRAPLRPTPGSPRAGMNSPPPPISRSSWNTDASRPTTGGSRTHIPNITAANFFRPMSSRQQREQNARPMSPPLQQPILSRASEETVRSKKRGHRSRRSDASIVTVEQNQRPLVDADAPPIPPSRDGHATQTSPTEGQMRSLRSQGSNAPLRPPPLGRPAGPPPTALKPERSPRSFRRSFGWQSRSDRSKDPKDTGHRRLESGPSSPESAMEKRPPPRDLGRNYEYYNGNAFFLFHGRLMNARQKPLNAVTGFLAVLPAALFFAFSAPYLSRVVSPAIPICFGILFYICISSYLHASFSDPGILPRNLHPHPRDASDDDPLALGPTTSNWVMVNSWQPRAPDAPATAIEVPVKYCKSCNIWRPPRAHHCRVCDACIETQDHHCVWLNNCVGRRNYRQFFTFVASATLLSWFLLGASLGHILLWMRRNDQPFSVTVNRDWANRGALATLIYSILVFPYPASLWGYHIFLIARGESTREYLNSHKFLKKDRHRPFDQHNYWRNFVSVLFRPRPPTYMQFKARYDEGDTRLGEKRSKDMRSATKEKEDLEMKQIDPGAGSVGFEGPQSRGPMNSTPRPTKSSEQSRPG